MRKLLTIVAAAAVVVLPVGAAYAGDDTYTNTTTPGGDNEDNNPGNHGTPGSGTEVEGRVEQPAPAPTDTPAVSDTGTLPVTGGDIVGLLVIGAGATAAGTVLVRQSRRRAAPAA
jgi:uncharacterized surface anchored protein